MTQRCVSCATFRVALPNHALACITSKNEHPWTLSPGPRENQVPNYGNRLLQQVDKSIDVGKYHDEKYSEVFQKKYCCTIRDTTCCHYR